MPAYACEKGCQNPKTKKATWHKKKADCPFEPEYKLAPAAPVATPAAPAAPAAPAPAPAVPKGGFSTLTIGAGKVAETVSRTDPKILAPAEEIRWVLPQGYTKRFYTLIYGGIRSICDVVGDFFEMPTEKRPKPEVFTVGKTMETVIDLDPNSMYAQGASAMLRFCGAKTLDTAKVYIDDAEVIAGFGGIVLALVQYGINIYKFSPRLIRDREEKAEKARLRKLAETTNPSYQVPAVAA